MNEKRPLLRNERAYRNLMLRIGAALLIFVALIDAARSVYSFSSTMLPSVFGAKAGAIISDLLYAGLYLASFMLPVAFFRLFSKGKTLEPMRLGLRLTPDSPLLIISAIGVIFACASLNSLILRLFISPDFHPEEVFVTPDYSENYQVVIQVISVALVPGICEEFLFRGMILSNLMPYGKTSAILVSSLLFGLMHQNPLQMFYTTMAGIALALIYIYTKSIWCSMIAHICNNGISVVEETLHQRLPEGKQWYILIVDIIIFTATAISILLLLKNRRKHFSEEPDFRDGIFEKSLPEAEGYQKYPVAPMRKVKLFFAPTMIVFLVISAIQMLFIFAMLIFGT